MSHPQKDTTEPKFQRDTESGPAPEETSPDDMEDAWEDKQSEERTDDSHPQTRESGERK